ncbi:MAG TPA: c-type cytochrome biogenesis protein CcmI [Stellaceae bacterium]|nr:c-type cytochrome biogenesis protein CcmI [Stellaceae bacterium]
MTLLFVILAMITVAALIPLLRPLMRGAVAEAPRAALDLAIYKDQLAELERDRVRGILSESETSAARLEIQRRLLAAMPEGAPGEAAQARYRPMPMVAVLLIVLVPALSIGLYALLGRPGLPDAPWAARSAERPLLAENGNLDLAKVKQALEQRLATDPTSLKGWIFLAQTDGSLKDWAGAKHAWEQARGLSHDRGDVLSGLAETLVAEAGGQVTDPARALFSRAAATDPKLANARYYLGLAAAQRGDLKTAIATWQDLLKDAPPKAPWRPQVAQMVAEAQKAPSSPSKPALPGPSPTEQAAIAALPPAEQVQAIRGMVDGLAAKLAANPNDPQGWQRLGRAYRVLGENGKAADAYGHWAALAPKDPQPLVAQAAALRASHGDGGNSTAALPDDAKALYEKAYVLDPRTPDALWFLGLAAAQVHDVARAASYWRPLLSEIDPSSPSYAQVKRALDGLKS